MTPRFHTSRLRPSHAHHWTASCPPLRAKGTGSTPSNSRWTAIWRWWGRSTWNPVVLFWRCSWRRCCWGSGRPASLFSSAGTWRFWAGWGKSVWLWTTENYLRKTKAISYVDFVKILFVQILFDEAAEGLAVRKGQNEVEVLPIEEAGFDFWDTGVPHIFEHFFIELTIRVEQKCGFSGWKKIVKCLILPRSVLIIFGFWQIWKGTFWWKRIHSFGEIWRTPRSKRRSHKWLWTHKTSSWCTWSSQNASG